MAPNFSPKVLAAKAIAERFGANQVVMILLYRHVETYECVTYGRTRVLCDDAKKLGRHATGGMVAHMSNGGGGE